MNRPWKLILLLVGIFLTGGVTGAFVALRFGREVVARRPTPEPWAPLHLKRLSDRLELTAEQQERIRPIVRRGMEDLNRTRETTVRESRRIFERMEEDVAAVLTPEQKVKYEQLNRELRERFQKIMRREGPKGPERSPHERPPGEPPLPPPGKPSGS